MSTDYPLIRLNNKADRRLRGGHVWIYSNEIDTKATPIKDIEPGQQVLIENAQGKLMGLAYLNPHNLICGRLISRDGKHGLDKSLLVHRINIALSLRQAMNDKPYYRLVYGDSDGLPGLVVDRFGEVLVVQLATAGMERVKTEIVEALCQVLKPSGILIKNDSRIRSAEGLEDYVEVAYGEVPQRVLIEENGVQFEVPVYEGQKTGWFYDHRASRANLAHYVKGKRVLDVFSYIGGWGVQAAAFGAESVMCVDSSEFALDCVHRNAELNGVSDKVESLQGNAFEAMKQLALEGERFDVVIMDPPAFIPRRKDIKKGEQAYRRVNELAMRLLNKDGILVSASCSMHLGREVLVDILRQSSRHIDRQLQILQHFGQTYDHPVHPAIPETDYLKAVFTRLLPVS
ncbi:class I SAM-dependent rRNA methyltransferase [Dasania sp. GY-MA-18]|uniref:Class I SAM-dependent rRNA methyltransferase n=1 Tax=Dasania phycosphaerae TaxID=2950436 RepID=A0A9J6RK61_9GAMM|nr:MULTISPECIES: class I SAM-dependent rRNA methyltransferase [Dasania]MCR8922188.1 class I SAM-dependent rRNA methyltransferase [Dasania sp. GY-MA-18]MCZ0864616.1 class I SAM-dependent rRNA methyltransferase [Dasania phycosphaerae]MCZ0868344.1 class I SAM-dependent rRNA methyltransferase [Dasania phycosphaerae]